jgi:hypothetical protein
MNSIPNIPGADAVVAWFGQWPSFHDAEVVEAHFVRHGISQLRLHFWNTRDEVDERGYYILDKHAIVTFLLEGIEDMDIYGFSRQNVISSLTVEAEGSRFLLTLGPCYGLAGVIEAKKLSVNIEPDTPNDRT